MPNSRVLLEGKQVVQVPFQAQIRASQRLVRVVRTAAFLVGRSFVEEALMLLKPCLQRALKRLLMAPFRVSVSRHSALPTPVFGLRVR